MIEIVSLCIDPLASSFSQWQTLCTFNVNKARLKYERKKEKYF